MIGNLVTGRVDPNADERVLRERIVPALRQARGWWPRDK